MRKGSLILVFISVMVSSPVLCASSTPDSSSSGQHIQAHTQLEQKTAADQKAEEDPLFFNDDNNNTVIPDPFESMNRVFFHFNMVLDHLLLKPVAQLYQRSPAVYRGMVSRFFSNLGELSTAFSDFVDGCIPCAFQDLSRFVINSSIGVLGFGDPASLMGLSHRQIDIGLVLARHGVPEGPYLMLPFLGPTSTRDTANLLLLGTTDLLPLKGLTVSQRNKILAIKVVSQRAGLLDAESVMDQTLVLDRYSYIRDAYAQYRFYQVQRLMSEKPFFEDPAHRPPEWSKKPLIHRQLVHLFSPLPGRHAEWSVT